MRGYTFYYGSHRQAQQTLQENNSTEEGGLPETSRLAPGVSGSFRTSPFFSERYKTDSPATGELIARGVVRRRWNRSTNHMEKPDPTGCIDGVSA